MARIKEFRGLRPISDLASRVAELPYDVVNSIEARNIAQGNPYNFYHITLAEIDLPQNTNPYDKIVYNKAKENLKKFIDEDTLEFDAKPNLYLYSQIMNGRMQTGLVACVHIDDYLQNHIKKHELVLDAKAEDRKNHIDILDTQCEPIFLFFKNTGDKKNLFDAAMEENPEYDFTTDDGIRHILRVISDEIQIAAFAETFKNHPLYIADGHHRAWSAVQVGQKRRDENPSHNGNEEYNWIMAVIFPHDQLAIMPYNRVVKDLNGLSKQDFFKKIQENYKISSIPAEEKTRQHTFKIYIDKQWHRLDPLFTISDDPVKGLDSQILQDTVLDPVLGISNPKKDPRIGFVGGIRGDKELVKLVDSGEYVIAFSMHPASLEELIKVSDNDMLMPPKSTWFEPKLRSGLFIHCLWK